ncbi:hypothetical protein LSAT2_004050 [Lamellibrachia satsuma]|nr:hypothetical protein LSAT2_004050 [Lamellibrachia satsuma]
MSISDNKRWRQGWRTTKKPFDMFGEIDDVNTLCRGLAAMPRLSILRIEFCELTDDGFIVICETLMSNCRQMESLWCRENYNLTSAIESHVNRALYALRALTIHLDRCPLQRACCVLLKQRFGDRIRVTY